MKKHHCYPNHKILYQRSAIKNLCYIQDCYNDESGCVLHFPYELWLNWSIPLLLFLKNSSYLNPLTFKGIFPLRYLCQIFVKPQWIFQVAFNSNSQNCSTRLNHKPLTPIKLPSNFDQTPRPINYFMTTRNKFPGLTNRMFQFKLVVRRWRLVKETYWWGQQ